MDASGEAVSGDGSIELVRDDDTTITWTWQGVDITGYTIYLTVREGWYADGTTDDTDATLQITADITDAVNGTFETAFSASETDKCDLNTVYKYDVQAVDGSGNITTIIRDTLQIVGDVTARTS